MTIIEDACHAIGGHRDGTKVGGAGGADVTCFSLHPVKSMTSGEGGLATTEDDELAARMRRFRTHGIVREHTSPSPTDGAWYMEMQELGFNYRITDFQCALGLSQLGRLDGWVARRNEIAARYRARLGDDARLDALAGGAGRIAARPPSVRRPRASRRARRAARSSTGCARPASACRCTTCRSTGCRTTATRSASRRTGVRTPTPTTTGAISLPMFPGLGDADVDRVVTELQRLIA